MLNNSVKVEGKFEQIIISVFNFEDCIKLFLSLYTFISVNQCYIFVKFEEKNKCILDFPFKPLSGHWLAKDALWLKSQ